MYQAPSPTHGYFPVVVAFWAYVALAGTAAFAARTLGASALGTVLVFLLAALALLKPFLPLFRQLLPRVPDER